MNFFKKIFDRKNGSTDELYFAGWEVILDGSEACDNFLYTQCVDKKFIRYFSSYIQLGFGSDGLLKQGRLFSEGREETEGHLLRNLQLDQAIGHLALQQWKPHQLLTFHLHSSGVHQLGGDFPVNFSLPQHNLITSFQYLGYIDQSDAVFSWLPFRLHLICPIFLNMDKIFLDYSNPLAPVLIQPEMVEKADCSYPELNRETRIVFEPVKFQAAYSHPIEDGLGHTGVPEWIQYPDIPRCPVTNKIMTFVCQLKSKVGIVVKESNVVPSAEFMEAYFKEMNFWIDGDLFVFFEPTSKVACYLIQNT